MIFILLSLFVILTLVYPLTIEFLDLTSLYIIKGIKNVLQFAF